MTCRICFGMLLHSCDVMGSLVLKDCFNFLALHASMVNRFCFGVPFGFGTCFGLLILVTLSVRECLGFLIEVGVVRSDFQVLVYHVGARLSVCGDFHLDLILSALGVFVMVVLGLSFLSFAKLHVMRRSFCLFCLVGHACQQLRPQPLPTT